MPVAEATLAAAEELHFLPVACHFAEELTRLRIEDGGADGHFYDTVLTILAERAACAAALAVGGEDVALIAQMKEGPEIAVATQDDVAAATAVAAVGPTLGHIFGTMEMPASRAALA